MTATTTGSVTQSTISELNTEPECASHTNTVSMKGADGVSSADPLKSNTSKAATADNNATEQQIKCSATETSDQSTHNFDTAQADHDNTAAGGDECSKSAVTSITTKEQLPPPPTQKQQNTVKAKDARSAVNVARTSEAAAAAAELFPEFEVTCMYTLILLGMY